MLNLIATICLHLYWHVKRQTKGKLYDEVVLHALDFTFTSVDYAAGYMHLYKKGMLLVEVLLEWQDQCASTSVPWKTDCLPLQMAAWRSAACMCRT